MSFLTSLRCFSQNEQQSNFSPLQELFSVMGQEGSDLCFDITCEIGIRHETAQQNNQTDRFPTLQRFEKQNARP
jgi:hypothetical protein